MIERTKYLNQLINTKITGFQRLLLVSVDAENLISLRIYTPSVSKEECHISDENILVVELDDDKNIELRNPITLGKDNSINF